MSTFKFICDVVGFQKNRTHFLKTELKTLTSIWNVPFRKVDTKTLIGHSQVVETLAMSEMRVFSRLPRPIRLETLCEERNNGEVSVVQ